MTRPAVAGRAAAAVGLLCAVLGAARPAAAHDAPPEGRVTLTVFADPGGAPVPCGCSGAALGGWARLAGTAAAAARDPAALTAVIGRLFAGDEQGIETAFARRIDAAGAVLLARRGLAAVVPHPEDPGRPAWGPLLDAFEAHGASPLLGSQADPVRVVRAGGRTVALVALTAPPPRGRAARAAHDAALAQALDRAGEADPDVTIGLSSAGPEADLETAARFPGRFSLIVGTADGDTGTLVPVRVGETLLVRLPPLGRYAGRIELELVPGDGRLTDLTLRRMYAAQLRALRLRVAAGGPDADAAAAEARALTQALDAPVAGSRLRFRLVPVDDTLPADPEVERALVRFERENLPARVPR